MTTTANQAARLYVLDQTTELGLVQKVLPGEYAGDMRVSTKLTITGTDEEGRHGFVDLTIRNDEQEGQAELDMDASQARQLAAYLLQIADELDTRTQSGLELRAAA